MKKITITAVLLMLLMAVFSGCANADDDSSAGNDDSVAEEDEAAVTIITTSFPAYDFARAVAGDKGDISMLIKPGAESHSYDPSPQDIIAIEQANMFIYIGGDNEEWAETILASVESEDLIVVRLMDYVDTVEEEIVEGMEDDHDDDEDDHDDDDEDDHDDDEIELDEHIWTSPTNAITLVEEIAAAISEFDEENQAYYTENAEIYVDEIAEIRDEMGEVIEEAEHQIMVFGDRFPFRYFAMEYGLDYRAAFPGCSTETEASAGTIAYLIDFVQEQELSYIYYIELSNQNIARTISEETGAEMLQMHSCQTITKDEFDAGETYVTLMRGNIESLRKGLN